MQSAPSISCFEVYNSGGDSPHEVNYIFAGKTRGFVTNNGNPDSLSYSKSIVERTATAGTGRFRGGANYSNDLQFGDFAQSISTITSFDQGSKAALYSVREGESLSSIAQSLWGDASLWYMLAEVNGMDGSSGLSEGQLLVIPADVLRNAHNDGTFNPYDANQALGDTSPTRAAPPKHKKCGGLGQFFVTIISIAVSTVLNMVAPGLGTVANAMIASATSQAIGVATGIQEKFSWNAVALAGIGAGVGGAVGKFMPKAGAVTQAVTASAITQGVGVATGLQDKFSWAGVAAAGVGAAVGTRFGGDSFGASLVRNTASGIANAATRSLIEGSDFGDNMLAALPDILGQAVGQTIGEAIAGSMTGRGAGTTGAPEKVGTTPQNASEVAVKNGVRQPSVEIGEISYPDNGVGDHDFMVNGIRVAADSPAYGELANVVRTDEGYDFTSRSDYRLRLDYSGEGDLFAIVRPVGHADGTISYSVGTQGGEFYSFGLSEKGASISALGLTITQELRPEVAAVRLMADVGRNPMVQAGLQTFGYVSSRIAEAVAPQQYAEMERNVAQVAGMWTGYVDRMVSEGRMTPQTGADFAVAVPTAVALGGSALGARGAFREARLGTGMLTSGLRNLEIDVGASGNGVGALGYVRLRRLSPAQRAAANGYPLIETTPNGGPDFAGTPYLFRAGPGQRSIVSIELTGSRAGDNRDAFLLAGIKPNAAIRKNYTWHHLDDFNPTTGRATMQLVETRAHRAASWHSGAVRQWELVNGREYD